MTTNVFFFICQLSHQVSVSVSVSVSDSVSVSSLRVLAWRKVVIQALFSALVQTFYSVFFAISVKRFL